MLDILPPPIPILEVREIWLESNYLIFPHAKGVKQQKTFKTEDGYLIHGASTTAYEYSKISLYVVNIK